MDSSQNLMLGINYQPQKSTYMNTLPLTYSQWGFWLLWSLAMGLTRFGVICCPWLTQVMRKRISFMKEWEEGSLIWEGFFLAATVWVESFDTRTTFGLREQGWRTGRGNLSFFPPLFCPRQGLSEVHHGMVVAKQGWSVAQLTSRCHHNTN